MTPATYEIKKTLLQRGDTIKDLASEWGYTRELLTKVIHCQRANPAVRRRVARYMKVPVRKLFAASQTQPRKKAA